MKLSLVQTSPGDSQKREPLRRILSFSFRHTSITQAVSAIILNGQYFRSCQFLDFFTFVQPKSRVTTRTGFLSVEVAVRYDVKLAIAVANFPSDRWRLKGSGKRVNEVCLSAHEPGALSRGQLFARINGPKSRSKFRTKQQKKSSIKSRQRKPIENYRVDEQAKRIADSLVNAGSAAMPPRARGPFSARKTREALLSTMPTPPRPRRLIARGVPFAPTDEFALSELSPVIVCPPLFISHLVALFWTLFHPFFTSACAQSADTYKYTDECARVRECLHRTSSPARNHVRIPGLEICLCTVHIV